MTIVVDARNKNQSINEQGVCRKAVSVFSLVERRANPRITVFSYPGIKRISRCVDSEEAHGYLCCAFAGTEYLLGQTTFPDFELVLWRWRTGERLTSVRAANTVDVDRTILACSIDSGRLVARCCTNGTLSLYRVLACSDLVRLFPLETIPRETSSVSWSRDGTLLCCDEVGNLWSVEFEEDGTSRIRTLVDNQIGTRRNSMVVAHGDGALVFHRSIEGTHARATFYRKSGDRTWSEVCTSSLPCYPSHAVSDPREEKILILGETHLYEITNASTELRIKLLSGHADYSTIAPLSNHRFVALDRSDRLHVLDGSTGSVSSTKCLTHHGKVVRLARHPSLPILATCSVTGNCLLVEGTLKITSCFHLQKEPLDRIEFSETGRALCVGSTKLDRLFILSTSNPERISWLNIGRKWIDFLMYDGDVERLLVLVARCSDDRIGKEIIVYTRTSGKFSKEHTIKLSASFETIQATGCDIVGVPYCSKQLHRIRLTPDFTDASLEALPSLHQMRKVDVHKSSNHAIITCGYDGLVVLRDCSEPRRVFAVFAAHHREQGGCLRAILVGNTIVSLGRNGDLVACKLSHRIFGGKGDSSKPDVTVRSKTTDRADTRTAANNDRSVTEEELHSPRSVFDDWLELKHRVKELLDSNEKQPPHARLPIAEFDLDQEARERELQAARSEHESLLRKIEYTIALRDRASSYLREQFLEPLIVPRRNVFSVFGRAKVANYPLLKTDSQAADLRAWSCFSGQMRQLVNRLEEDNKENQEKLFDASLDLGFVEVLEGNIEAEERERELQVRFNDRFEELRRARRDQKRTARKLADDIRSCVDELKREFGADANTESIEIPRWDGSRSNSIEASDSSDESVNSPESEVGGSSAEEVDFRREALDRMMDGLLEFRLKRRSVQKSSNAEQEFPTESYDLASQRVDRSKYKALLESEIARAKDEFQSAAEAFDEQLRELSLEKIRVERSVLSERLSRVGTILDHRRIVKLRREIRRANEDLSAARTNARKLDEERELFEAGVDQLKHHYESERERDKSLEQLLIDARCERSIRRYRPKPRIAEARFASVTLLDELAACLTNGRSSEILPTEWLDYLRSADTVPEAFRSEPERWRAVCQLGRQKLEAETKVKRSAIQLAEAEDSVAFLRNACWNARAAIERREREIGDLREALLEITENREVRLVAKTGQLQRQPEGCPRSDWQDAILAPRSELVRANQAIVEAAEKRLLATRRLAKLRRIVSAEEWRHARAKTIAKESRERAKDLDAVKVSRAMLEPRNETTKKPVRSVRKISLVRETIERHSKIKRRRRKSKASLSYEHRLDALKLCACPTLARKL
ncbi:uncharacterized protein LOC100879973 isoform X1 [Megachile rotundata]|uniref:uncharacterized protein LOC100879973 isoform X1 n=1 Tax=Megachile rotundata TaxID=143995 RepID=UPI003FD47E24